MQKSVLETFIRKYSLNGICEAAHWYSDSEKQTLTALSHTETKTVILKVVLKKWEGVETCQLALPSSTKIKSMLSPLGDEFTITLNKVRDRVVNFTIADPDCESICTVAEYDAFPETFDVDSDVSDMVPNEFEVEINLTEDFLGRMMKSVSALKEAKDFVLMNNRKGVLDMIINYEDTNTNRIRIPLETVSGKNIMNPPFAFSTSVFKEIVVANEIQCPKPKDDSDPSSKPMEVPILKVSNRGIAIIKFEDDLFRSTYFLFPTREIR